MMGTRLAASPQSSATSLADEISDSDKRLLKRVPYLEYILVNNEEDTRELLHEINDGSSISTLKVAPPPRLENP